MTCVGCLGGFNDLSRITKSATSCSASDLIGAIYNPANLLRNWKVSILVHNLAVEALNKHTLDNTPLISSLVASSILILLSGGTS